VVSLPAEFIAEGLINVSIAISATGKVTNGWKCTSSPVVIIMHILHFRLLKHGAFCNRSMSIYGIGAKSATQ
jgi:hypothetical protein